MKFKDFEVGMVIRHDPVIVTEAEMLEFAHKYDPQWFHIDMQRAQEGRWVGLIGNGWLTGGIAMRMAVESALKDSDSFGSPGLERLRWVKPVRAGDSLRLEASVDSKRISSSRPDLGIVRWTWQLYNQHDELVFETEATNLFEIKPEMH